MKPNKLANFFVIWLVGSLVITWISQFLLPLRIQYLGGGLQAYERNPFLYSRANFDGIHYAEIARIGYGYAQQAFFPLYPGLIHDLNFLFNNLPSTGIFISLACFALGLYVLSRLVRLDYPETVVKWTIVTLLVFPTSFYFGCVYTEGLFLLLSVSAFYFARTQKWWLAAIFGCLAANTRFVGVFLFPVLLLEFFNQAVNSRKSFRLYLQAVPLFLIPLGLFSYMSYLQKSTGDFLAFIHVQQLFNQGRSDKIVLLYQVFYRYVRMVLTVNRADPLYLTVLLEFASGIAFFFLSLLSLIKHRSSYAFYAILSFILPTLTGSFTSVPRYVLVIFPVFILIGNWLSRASGFKRVLYLGINIVIGILFLSLFVRGYWVA